MFDPIHCKPGMIVRSETPYYTEPLLGRLRAFSTTAWPDFYVRSHGNTPALDEANHSLQVAGRVGTPLDVAVAELRAQSPSAPSRL